MEERVRQCYWNEGMLVVETDTGTYRVSSTVGVKALKSNRLPGGEISGLTDDLVLFTTDDPRRMALIQEQMSGLKD